MTMARWQATIVDEQGNIVPNAQVSVFRESDGALPALKSNREGTSSKSNPFTADSEGFAFFHAVGGSYRIVASLGAFEREWRYVGIGTASETDIPGGVPNGRITAAGTYDVDDVHRGYQVEATVAGNVTFNLGPSADRLDLPFTVALVGADPTTHTITVDFDGSETCRGAGAFVFESPYQVVTFYPLAAGGGYYIG
jgi:hypothetical protein